MAESVFPPQGCAVCGVEKRGHGDRYTAPHGGHQWIRPTEDQVKLRLQLRRAIRLGL